jgi:23S rRNA (adenine2503-C2)-methyltransferase
MTVSSSGAADPEDARPNLYGLDRERLAAFLSPYAVPGFHAGQLFRWLYARRRYSAADWTDLPRGLRDRIAADARVDPGRIVSRTEASDGTVKYRVRVGSDDVECVHMRQSGRTTLCVSSQVGCALACDFCLTGRMGLVRHLSPGEIVGQVARMQDDAALDAEPFNVVFMGMGEPLHNYDGTLAAIRLLADPEGFGLSRRRITVSTSGLVPAIARLATEPVRPRLAVSLNATTDGVRGRLMPINRRHDLASLVEACAAYRRATGEDLTFEYVLLAGVNDSDADVDRLARLARRAAAKLNLIPFNAVPGRLPYRAPRRERVAAVRDRLLERGVRVSIRWSRGADARAACGQLAIDSRGADPRPASGPNERGSGPRSDPARGEHP